MNPVEASVAAGCLCASFIGGSVNFFATARILSSQLLSDSTTTNNSATSIAGGDNFMSNNLFSSMAAADLILMALYFGGLSAMLSSKKLKIWFPGRFDEEMKSFQKGNNEETPNIAISNTIETKNSSSRRKQRKDWSRLACSSTFAALISWGIVELSILFENSMSYVVPGMGCAAVATLGSVISSIMEQISKNSYTSFTTTKSKERSPMTARHLIHNIVHKTQRRMHYLKQDLNKVTSPMSDICFHLLFAAIGTSANIRQALINGPSCFIFATIALLCHVFCICSGSIGLMRIRDIAMTSSNGKGLKINRQRRRIFPLGVEEVLVASNALIGGASTAAAFAGSIGGSSTTINMSNNKRQKNTSGIANERKNALVIAATLWGVIGYAFATTIGIAVSKFMMFLLCV